MDLPAAEARMVHRAALIHDVGRFGVPGSVWDKPGPLIGGDLERMRMHVYYVERIFNRPEPLRQVGRLAATHHERTDGSGYHRGVTGGMLSAPARVLAAADAYHAMTQRRPHRGAMTEADAARHLRSDADAGKLDPAATDAVLAAAGHVILHRRTSGQAGLTPREREVLRLLAEGLPNKAIARRLGISPKTVGNHVEHVYAKLEVSNRAAAAMSAMQSGLMSTGPQHSSN
jgi:HD-GYP domain-containing protein (c-di-GMP phosphodiesterase class II)